MDGDVVGQRRHVHLPQHRAQHQVAVGHLAGALDHVGHAGGLRQIRQPDDQRTPLLRPEQRRGRRRVIAFDGFGPRLRQHFEQAAQVPRAAIGRDARVDAAAVRDQADAIT